MSQFKYRPLNSEHKEIRLLEILTSGTDVSPTTCQISTVSLTESKNVTFAALSYVWGDASVTTDIILDGTAFPVTTNLALALQYIKHHWQQQYPANDQKSFRLWVDAICINQSDVQERNNQVQMMGSIYSMAEVVFSWLGASEKIGLAMQTVRLICQETKETLGGNGLCLQWMEKYPSLCIEDDEFIGEGGLGNKAWMALWDIFLLPYWERTWTFQEMALARNLIMVCNTDSILYMDFHDFCVWYGSIYEMKPIPPPRPPSMIDSVWRAVSGGLLNYGLNGRLMYAREKPVPGVRKWRLLTLCRNLHATEPRDHVYGALAVIERDCETTVITDYEKTVPEVYCESISRWVEEDQTLLFLFSAGLGYSKNYPDLPTWVPDFSQACFVTALSICTGNADRMVFKDTSDRTIVSGGVLKVQGVKIDVVQRMSEAPKLDTWRDGRMLSFCLNFVRRHPIYITGIPPLQALYHTMMMTYLEYNPPYQHYSLCIEALAFLCSLLTYSKSLGLGRLEVLEMFGLSIGDAFLESFEKIIYPGCDIHNFGLPNISKMTSLPPGPLWDAARTVVKQFAEFENAHHFIETSEGYIGLAPTGIDVGDIVCVLKGSQCPVVLRKIDDHYVLVGTCHILGLMNGEAATVLATGKVQEERFEIW